MERGGEGGEIRVDDRVVEVGEWLKGTCSVVR